MNKYKRIIIKLSGEALADEADRTILDKEKLVEISKVIRKIHDEGVEVAVVVGAGNIWRGRLSEKIGIEQATADYMGMLGTIINALAVQNALEQDGLQSRVMSSINVPQVAEPYIRRRAMSHMEKGVIVIFAGGTGNPYFTTDTTATLRALEIGAEAILMGKNGVDGIYDDDPRKNKDAKFLKEVTHEEVISRKLGIMDLTAVAMLQGKNVEIRVFNMDDPENFLRIVKGEDIGSIIR